MSKPWADAFLDLPPVIEPVDPAPEEAIIAEVCAQYSVCREELVGHCRCRPLVVARHEAMRRCYEETDLTLVDVGRLFHRDHTTVMHAIRKLEAVAVNDA